MKNREKYLENISESIREGELDCFIHDVVVDKYGKDTNYTPKEEMVLFILWLDEEYQWNEFLFDHKRFGHDVVMRCDTEEKAKIFARYLHHNGKKWCHGESYIEDNYWQIDKEYTCYCFNDGMRIHYKDAVRDGYTILHFDAYEWSEYEDPKVDWSQIKEDTPIMVKRRNETEKEWKKRYFAKYENNKVYTWAKGCTSWSQNEEDFLEPWQCAKLVETE